MQYMGFWDCGQQGRWPKFIYFYLKLIFFFMFLECFDALILKKYFFKKILFIFIFKKIIVTYLYN